jgi:hypothetical protein
MNFLRMHLAGSKFLSPLSAIFHASALQYKVDGEQRRRQSSFLLDCAFLQQRLIRCNARFLFYITPL